MRRSQKPTWSNSQANSKPAACCSRPWKSKLSVLVSARHRRVEEPALADVDAAEELPVALQVRVQHAVGRALGEALEAFVQLARAEHGQHHALVEVGAAALDAELLAHQRAAAVAADDVVGLEDLRAGAAFARRSVTRTPSSSCSIVCAVQPNSGCHGRQRRPLRSAAPLRCGTAAAVRCPGSSTARTSSRPRRRVPVLAHQVAVGGDAADRIARRHDARGAQLVDDAPEVEVLERALGRFWPLGIRCGRRGALDQRAGDRRAGPSSTASATPTGPPPTMTTW